MRVARKRRLNSTIPRAPAGDPAFAPLYDSRMLWSIRRAQCQVAVRSGFQSVVGMPLERIALSWWQAGLPGTSTLEKLGLPRRAVEERLGDALVLHVDPRELVRITAWRGYAHRQRPSSSTFLWDGDWDLRRADLRYGSRYCFIRDIVMHRHDLRQTERFRELRIRLAKGRPWSSHQQGILLDSEERILAYLGVYLSFLDDMAVRGFDSSRGKDDLGVAVTREGRLLKINRGLHRLAMAQRLGLPSVPVTVKAVHREWWEKVTVGTVGQAALDRLKDALRDCTPEIEPGPLDPVEEGSQLTG